MAKRPLLLVDVDGVISLFGFAANAVPPGSWALVEGIAHLLSATAGEHLRHLHDDFEIVWCTGWEERADEHLRDLLGLAHSYPHLTFERSPGRVHAHWKLDAIEEHAGTRPLAWIDDAHDDACREWAHERDRFGAPTLLLTTEPAIGITDEHVRTLADWAANRS